MPLTLEVVGQKAAQMGSTARKVFQAGGTIGRLRDNDWVLPDEYISGHHAKISFVNGAYLIEDTSTNGVFINSPQKRMTRGQPYALRNGDTVYIDDYEVRVTLSADSPMSAGSAAPPAGYAPAPAGYAPAPAGYAPAPMAPGMIAADPFVDAAAGVQGAPTDTDPLSLLGLQGSRPVAPGPSAASLAGNSPLSQHYQPPPVSAPPPPIVQPPAPGKPAPTPSGLIPENYDPFASEEAPAPVRSPPRPAAPPPRPAIRTPPSAPPASVASPTILTGPPLDPFAPRAEAAEPPRGARPVRTPEAPAPGGAFAPGTVPMPGAAPAAVPRPAAVAARTPDPAPSPNPPSVSPGGERRARSGAGKDLDFAALLSAAGIDSERVGPEVSQQFGQILRVVVAGLMDVLRARERIKDEFRMRVTTFKQQDNNPLKFSANVEDALHNLLVKRNAAYLGPVEAFEDAFQDLRNHQMAMLAGMRVAYDAMLAEFEPERLQEDFDRQVKAGSFLSGPAKLKYWDLYRNRFHDMVKDADSSFRNLFGDEFAKAYEEQLVRLKTLNRAERK
jgi:type VI secretion system FHA domain protein